MGDRTIGADLEMLLRALRWAVRERKTSGERLLKENPLIGVRLPCEKNPKRPVMQHDEYLKLLEVAERVHPLLKLALIVAEGTGRRLSAWRNLFWDDVDFDVGTIRWRAAHDKKGYEQVVPMSNAVKRALTAARRAQKAIGNMRSSLPRATRRNRTVATCSTPGSGRPISWPISVASLGECGTPCAGSGPRSERATRSRTWRSRVGGGLSGPYSARTSRADAATVRQVVLHPTQRVVSR